MRWVGEGDEMDGWGEVGEVVEGDEVGEGAGWGG